MLDIMLINLDSRIDCDELVFELPAGSFIVPIGTTNHLLMQTEQYKAFKHLFSGYKYTYMYPCAK